MFLKFWNDESFECLSERLSIKNYKKLGVVLAMFLLITTAMICYRLRIGEPASLVVFEADKDYKLSGTLVYTNERLADLKVDMNLEASCENGDFEAVISTAGQEMRMRLKGNELSLSSFAGDFAFKVDRSEFKDLDKSASFNWVGTDSRIDGMLVEDYNVYELDLGFLKSDSIIDGISASFALSKDVVLELIDGVCVKVLTNEELSDKVFLVYFSRDGVELKGDIRLSE